MNEEIKTESFDDEENLRTTPERQSIIDYKKANIKLHESVISTNINTDRDSENNMEVKTEPQEELGDNDEVTKEIMNNEYIIQTLVAGTTMEQTQPNTPERMKKVKSTELSKAEGTITSLDIESVQTNIEVAADNENIGEPIKSLELNSNKKLQISPPQVEHCQNTNPLEITCFRTDTEQDRSKNTTPLENSDVSVKTEPEVTAIDTIDLDMTIARPKPCETISNSVAKSLEKVKNVSVSEISETLVETSTKDVNEPINLIDATAEPVVTSSDIEPPPPPTISASQVRDPIDGTATPRITLAPMSRLRVKTEFSLAQTPQSNGETSTLPPDFFDDLLSVDKRSESGEISSGDSDARSQDDPIPDNFFDDLLRDQFKERIEEAQNDELEEKYSDRLKELKRLREKSRERKKSHKKQKKSKKKSHKRSRSRSPPPGSREKRRDRHNRSPSPIHMNNKRSRMTPGLQQLPSTLNYGNLNKVTKDGGSSIFINQGLQVKSEFRTCETTNEISNNRGLNTDIEMLNPVKVEFPEVNCEEVVEVEEILTPKKKRERAMMRAATLVSHLTNMSSDTNSILSTFQYTSIVRKLPTSHSFVNQQIYENRSPLHTVNNVNYKFNSHATRFNLEEWGLATLPPHAAKIAKLIGCDALTIHNKLKTIKIPAKLQKSKSSSNEQGEEVIETTSSFFCNVMTQTDDVKELEQLKTKGYEIGVQVEPSLCNIGCQTLETQSPTKNQSDQEELPIMRIMHDLNENQLMAIHDFAELMREPAGNAMDMYALRMRMLEIYKCSQLPSASDAPPTQVINNYTTSKSRHYSQQGHRRPVIQSVSSADGSHYSVNDPRAKSAAYTSRGVSYNYDPRYSAFTQPTSNKSPSSSESRYLTNSPSSISRQRSSSTTQQTSTSSTGKYYGRGGLRRQ